MNARPLLILVPGLMCDEVVWADQAAALAGHCEVQVAQHGLQDSLAGMAAQVLATARAECFAIAGHSMGGRVALEVLRQAPQRVQGLAVLDTGCHALGTGEAAEKERSGRLALLAQAQTEGMRAMGQAWARGMVHPSRLGTPLFERILDMIERSSPAVAVNPGPGISKSASR